MGMGVWELQLQLKQTEQVTVFMGDVSYMIRAEWTAVSVNVTVGTTDSQSLYARDDGVERGLDVGCGAGANHGQMVVLKHVWQILREKKKH